MYLLSTAKKDEALINAQETARWALQHEFKPIITGPGGLRMSHCAHCGRAIYANHHGSTFGSAAREKCDAT